MLILGRFKGLLRGIQFYSSGKKYNKDLFSSRFHSSGLKHFQKSKLLCRSMPPNVVEIEETQLNI
jgi:hypothetical protein